MNLYRKTVHRFSSGCLGLREYIKIWGENNIEDLRHRFGNVTLSTSRIEEILSNRTERAENEGPNETDLREVIIIEFKS